MSATPWRAWAELLAAPIAVLLLRAGLQARADQDTSGLQRLHAATLVADPYQAMWAASRPFVLTALGLLATALVLRWGLRAALRRHGWARVRPWAVALWSLAWLAAGAALVASHLNQAGRHAVGEQTVRVLLARTVPASERSPGGAELYIELARLPGPQRLLAEGQPPTAWPPGSLARLHLEAGRWWGHWARVSPVQTR